MANGSAYLVTGWETNDLSAFTSSTTSTDWTITTPTTGARTGRCMDILRAAGTGSATGAYVTADWGEYTGNQQIAEVGQPSSETNFMLIRFYHNITQYPAPGGANNENVSLVSSTVGLTLRHFRRAAGNILYDLGASDAVIYDTGLTGATGYTYLRVELFVQVALKQVTARISTPDTNTILGEYTRYVSTLTWPTTINIGCKPASSGTQHATHQHQFDDLTIIADRGDDAITTWLGDGKIRGPVTATGSGSFAEQLDDTSGGSVYTNLTEAWPTPDGPLPGASYNTSDYYGAQHQRDAWAMGNASGMTGEVIRWGLHDYAAGGTANNIYHWAGLYVSSQWNEGYHVWTHSDTNWRYGMISGNIASTSAFDGAEVAYRRNSPAGSYDLKTSAVQVEYEDDQGYTPLTIKRSMPHSRQKATQHLVGR